MWIITTLSSLFSANLHNNASILILDISNKCGTSGCNQTCTNIVDSYICSCFDGYILDADGHSCNGKVYIAHTTLFNNCFLSDVDECSEGTDGCHQQCLNTQGSYICSCNTGYELLNTTHCTDTDECADNNGGCDHNCINTVGSFECSCNSGYTLGSNGFDCNGQLLVYAKRLFYEITIVRYQ